MGRCHPLVHHFSKCIHSRSHKILQEESDHIEGKEEDQGHDSNKHRNCGPLSRKDPVDLATSLVFPALSWLYDRLITEALDEDEAHVRNGSRMI